MRIYLSLAELIEGPEIKEDSITNYAMLTPAAHMHKDLKKKNNTKLKRKLLYFVTLKQSILYIFS